MHYNSSSRPTGNAPPICLTEFLPPEKDARMLLLGCGGAPRNVLFTVWANNSSPRIMDFTCCDVETAVLARNILLFTLIYDNPDESSPHIWNIYFHPCVDNRSLILLLAQCQKLIDVSVDAKRWQKSKYGVFLKPCNRRSLAEVRGLWIRYVQTRKFSAEDKSAFENALHSQLKSNAETNPSALRSSFLSSAGPLSMCASDEVAKQFRHFWKTGTVSTHDDNSSSFASSPNPTFAYSSSKDLFAFSSGTYPLQAFHLFSAFVPLSQKLSTPSSPTTDIVQEAQKQFGAWCRAFKASLRTPGKVVIRFFAGDVSTLCSTILKTRNKSTCFTAHGSPSRLYIDEGEYNQGANSSAPLTFDTIYTSHLADHIGLLNTLTITVPLLKREPSATLYTETIESGGDATKSFLDRVCGIDLSMISVLFDVVPPAYVSGYTSYSNLQEILAHRFSGAQLKDRVVWKIASLGDPATAESNANQHLLSFDVQDLASILFCLYKDLFPNLDTFLYLQKPNLRGRHIPVSTSYVPEDFISFLSAAKQRLQCDWNLVTVSLLEMIRESNGNWFGESHFQDLRCHAHLQGLSSVAINPPDLMSTDIAKTNGVFRGWDAIPPVICIVLVVPRQFFGILSEMKDVLHTSTKLHFEVRNVENHHIFQSIQICFGSMEFTGSEGNKQIVIVEGGEGDSLNLPGVVSAWVPSSLFLVEPEKIQVSLSIDSTPATAAFLVPNLGIHLDLFSTNLIDAAHVHLVRNRPGYPGKLSSQLSSTSGVSPITSMLVRANFDDARRKVSTLTLRKDVVEPKARQTLQQGAVVKPSQTSPYKMQVVFGDVKIDFVFPYPIDGNRHNLRIARKSLYIEMVVPMSDALTKGGFSLNKFPTSLSLITKSPSIWNLHYICLNDLPVLDTQDPSKLDWLQDHVSMSFSSRERQLFVSDNHEDVLVNIKTAIHTIFVFASGVQEQRVERVFCLSQRIKGGDTLIFVSHLRLDVASHTVVADAYVLPLTRKTVPLHSNFLARIHEAGIINLNNNDETRVAWKRLLVTFAERCRTWKHKPHCEYRTKGIPVSLEHEKISICSCGKGCDNESFLKIKEWKQVAKEVTRIAIGPLFPVSYLESVCSLGEE